MRFLRTKSALSLLLFALGLFLLSAPSLGEPSPTGTLTIGEHLTYTRGTARAKEEVLEFPYTYTGPVNGKKRKKKRKKRRKKRKKNKGKDDQTWAYVVHEGRGSRLYCKEAEAQGEKDKTGHLVHQDFPPDHPFTKTLDVIKQDAFLNVRKALTKSKTIERKGWTVVSGNNAVNNLFYKDSEGRIHAFLAIQEEGKENLTGPPITVYFKRTRQGPVVSRLADDSTNWSTPQVIDLRRNPNLFKVFRLLENRNGF